MRLPTLILISSFIILFVVPVHFSAAATLGTTYSVNKSAFTKTGLVDTTFGPNYGSGQKTTCDNSKGLCNPLKVDSVSSLLTIILGFIIKIGTVIIVLMLVWTGFKFVISQGKPEEIQKARTMLMWTIIGALVILGAQAIALGIAATVKSITS